MQFNVPQFTEEEDKVIGPLTVRQFILLMAAGGLTFLSYSLSKSTVATVIIGLFVSLPALVAAFGQFNGRHLYRVLPVFLKFVTVPKVYVFQKEAKTSTVRTSRQLSGAQKAVAAVKNSDLMNEGDEVHSRLKRIQYQLNQRKTQEEEIVSRIKN